MSDWVQETANGIILLLLRRSLSLDVHASGSHERRRLLQSRKVAVQLLPQGGAGGGVSSGHAASLGVGSRGVGVQCP